AVLDVGFGLGYGLQIMAAKVNKLIGLEVDARAVDHGRRIFKGHPRIKQVLLCNGEGIPFKDKSFDVVTCVEVLEHVEDYKVLLLQMVRVSKRLIFITTPNRRLEYTTWDGKPRNYWHLREWSYQGLDTILQRIPDIHIDWNFLNGSWNGPFEWGTDVSENTLTLAPALVLDAFEEC
ncbi:MAG TPA: class I SAM-dependent methyltransferase, partial [bacterium]|nr:class I SAM-dependent methyltransferase [bacterium]